MYSPALGLSAGPTGGSAEAGPSKRPRVSAGGKGSVNLDEVSHYVASFGAARLTV